MDHAEYIKRVRSYIKVPTKEIEEQLDDFCSHCTYVAGQYDQDEPFQNLNKHLEELEGGRKEQNRVFYMALPPSVFITVSEHLKKHCYPKEGIARIIVRRSHHQWVGKTWIANRGSLYRWRSHLERIWAARANFRELWNPIGRKRKFSVSTTTLERRWLRTS